MWEKNYKLKAKKVPFSFIHLFVFLKRKTHRLEEKRNRARESQ